MTISSASCGVVYKKFKAYLSRKDTYGKAREGLPARIAYFSAEFGFHESVPNYSGGLGILAGDHCKSASDLDLHFIAFALLYRHGYFRQQINKEGWQESVAAQPEFLITCRSWRVRATRRASRSSSTWICSDQPVHAKVWQLAVGRITLYLLDTDIPENTGEDRLITAQLYGGDLEMRIRQEIVLGIGGVACAARHGHRRPTCTT